MDSQNERSDVEIFIFLGLKVFLCLLTFLCLILFIKEAFRYSKLQGEERDSFTIATFILLTISQFSLLINSIYKLVLQTAG